MPHAHKCSSTVPKGSRVVTKLNFIQMRKEKRNALFISVMDIYQKSKQLSIIFKVYFKYCNKLI